VDPEGRGRGAAVLLERSAVLLEDALRLALDGVQPDYGRSTDLAEVTAAAPISRRSWRSAWDVPGDREVDVTQGASADPL